MKNKFINLAIKQALIGLKKKEVPVGAVIVDNENNIISKAHNLVEKKNDPSCHAEMLAIKKALKVTGERYLQNCSIWVTLEPCIMCSGVILQTRIKRLYFGAEDKKMGSVENGLRVFYNQNLNHKVEIYHGFQEDKVKQIMSSFFKNLRSKN